MKKLTTLTVLLLMLITTVANAQMYKWTDENGQTHFSDKPHKTAKKIKVDGSGKVKVVANVKNSKNTQRLLQQASSKSIRIKIRKLLKKGKYKQLNKTLDQLDRSFKKDIKNEQQLFMAYETFLYKKNLLNHYSISGLKRLQIPIFLMLQEQSISMPWVGNPEERSIRAILLENNSMKCVNILRKQQVI